MREIRVLLNSGATRKEVTAELIRTNTKTVVVRLPDGNVVKRNIKRDVVGGLPK